MRVIISIY